MKLAPLDYHRAQSVEHAIALLGEYHGNARIIAGGQSLIPMLAYRLAAPCALIDIGRLTDLATIVCDDSGTRIGSLVRWCDIQSSTEIRRRQPLLHEAIGHIAHYQIRNRGTIGGSLAHCDPAAECPAVVLACHGQIDIQGPGGTRSLRADDFFQGPLTTDLAPDEIITSIRMLRHDLRLTGTHVGCEHGVCGACTVIVNGEAVRSCLLLTLQAEGWHVRTVEGLASNDELSDLQQAFQDNHALQCGFCTPGILMTAEALLTHEPDASEERIVEVLSGHICRCTGYLPITKAIVQARDVQRSGGQAAP
jgi:xanthine dehydrogenase iron-sulfur cluster and FAD-binding subunit A